MWYTLNGKARNQLRTFKGLAAIIKQTNHYKSVRDKDYLLDKVDWFVSSIIDTNLKLNQDVFSYVNIHSKRLRAFLGKDYNVIIDLMVELDLISKNNNYSSNNFTKSFRLTSKLVNGRQIKSVEIRSNRFDTKLEKLKNYEQQEVLKNPLYVKIISNTLKISFINDYVHYIPIPETIGSREINGHIMTEYEDNDFQMNRYSEFGKILNQLSKETEVNQLNKMSLYYSPKVSSYGRLYHFICSVPSRVRKLIRTKENELIYEVDMSSAQLTILILEWVKSGHHNKANSKEVELITQLLIKGEIYDYIQSESKHFGDMSYKNLKVSILKIINAKYNPGDGNKELERLFPGFMHWVNRMKQNQGHQSVSHIHQKAESDIFIKVYEELPDNMFALPIHDCIISTKKNIKQIQERLIQRFENLYGKFVPPFDSLDKVFRINRVSLKDEELTDHEINNLNESDYKSFDF